MSLALNALVRATTDKFETIYGSKPEIYAYAPGRVEILGNHTDYNEGVVLSAGIDYGACFCLRKTKRGEIRIGAGDDMETISFQLSDPPNLPEPAFANYVIGVAAGIGLPADASFDALFFSNVPKGGGLSSSAALEMSQCTALQFAYGLDHPPVELATIGQQAEHKYVGVKCGLLDQISSLFAKDHRLVHTDFRTLEVSDTPFGTEAELLICNSHAKHKLVESEYNERRTRCEEAAAYFAEALDHPVSALRDVSWDEWEAHREKMPEGMAKRAAHVIGENARVTEGRELLAAGDIPGFGALMYASHESSQNYFENSCPELDTLVDATREMPDVYGARLSGGGFGGCIVALIRAGTGPKLGEKISAAFESAHGRMADWVVITPSQGARILEPGEAS